MAKRSRKIVHQEEQGEVDDDVSGTPGETPDPGYSEYDETTAELRTTVNQVVRVVVCREARGQYIRRENITPYITSKMFPYDVVLKEVKAELEEVYGMTLVEAPHVSEETTKKRAKSQARPPYVLISSLHANTKRVLGDIWLQSSELEVNNGRKFSDNEYFLPKYNKTNTPLGNQELVRSGLMLLVVTLVILSENHLSDTDMVASLRKFGINDGTNTRNSNTNMDLAEFVSDIIKKDYIYSETHENVVSYRLGRRSLVEFTPQCVFEYIKNVYGEDFDTTVAEQTLVTIERVYGAESGIAELIAGQDNPDPPGQSPPGGGS